MILLTSTAYIKSHSGLNDNTYDKMIVPALERAQDIDLTEALGLCLVESLQGKVGDGSIDAAENALYKVLLDNYVQPFLTYTVLANITLELGQVMGNGGVDTVSDEHRQSLSLDERGQIRDYWSHHADAYRLRMAKWVRNNRGAFPELEGCTPCGEGPNLESAAGPSLWLGGPRGKLLNPKRILR